MYNSSLISARFRRVTAFKFIQGLCFSALLVICKLSKYTDESAQKQVSLLQKNLKLGNGSLNYYYFEKQVMIIVHFYSARNHYNEKVLTTWFRFNGMKEESYVQNVTVGIKVHF